MRFYLRQEGGAGTFFSVYDGSGRLACEVTGEATPVGRRFVLRTPNGVALARMTEVDLPACARYSVSAGRRHIRVWISPKAAAHRAVRFKGVQWRFRGSFLTRSFDIAEDAPHGDAPRIVMTHGRCWNGRGVCYAAEIPCEADVPLALCVAAAVDSFVLGDCVSPVPAG